MTYDKGEGVYMFYSQQGGDMPSLPTVYGCTTPSLPRIPPTYTDKMTRKGGDNPNSQVCIPYPQKKFWKNFLENLSIYL